MPTTVTMSKTKLKPKAELYQPLDSKSQQFRLLRIRPGQKQQPIKCDLYKAVLKRRMGFNALSYVWGWPEPTKEIFINGQALQIRTNLYDAMQRLRCADKPYIIWIDAICINQSDDVEKGHQVNLMSRIYTFATSVIAWLGDVPHEHEPSCVHLFNMIRKHNDKLPMPRGKVYQEDLNECAQTLLTSDWFYRVWIVQEAMLPRDLRMMLGPAQASFEDIPGKTDSFIRMLDKEGIQIRSNQFSLIKAMRDKKLYPRGSGVTLLSILRDAWSRGATDKRDMTYALLGAINDWQGYPPMTADYTVDERSVTILTAFEVIRRQRSLEFLVPAGLHANRKHARYISYDLPSWVPPFSKATLRHAQGKRSSRPYTKDLRLIHGDLLSMDATFLGIVDRVSSIDFPRDIGYKHPDAKIYNDKVFDDELPNITEVPRILDIALLAERIVKSNQHLGAHDVKCLKQIFARHGHLIKLGNKRSGFTFDSSDSTDPIGDDILILRHLVLPYLSNFDSKENLEKMEPEAYSRITVNGLKRIMHLWVCWCALDEVHSKEPPPTYPRWHGFTEHMDDDVIRQIDEIDHMQSWLHYRPRRVVRTDGGAAFAIAGVAEPGDMIFDLGGQAGLFVLRAHGTRTVESDVAASPNQKKKSTTVETYKLVEHCAAIAVLDELDGTPQAEKKNQTVARVYIC